MKMLRCLLVLVYIIMLPGIISAEIMEANYTVTQEDPAGDVINNGDNPGKDVVKVTVDTDGTNMNIIVVLAKEAKFYLDGHQAGDVINVIIDADNKSETGGKPFFYEGT